MTYLEIVNKVLRGLRENTVLGVTAGYAAFIGQLVNEVKTDIEDMGPWYALRTTVTGTLVAGTAEVNLTASTNERSYLLLDGSGRAQAWITTADEERRLSVLSEAEMDHIQTIDPGADQNVPYFISLRRTNDGLVATLYPTPDAAYTYKFQFVVPQAELTAATTELLIPSEPVWREALVRAMEERGEEFSGSLDRHARRANAALNAALMRDFMADNMTVQVR